MNITSVYFSATYTTKKVVKELTSKIGDSVVEYDITNDGPMADVIVPNSDLLVVGMPVYAGRVPTLAADRLRKFKGDNTPAIIVAVYGNRHYDDALVEMYDILSEQGFRIASAGAFIAQHCIFPKVGANRPDAEDLQAISLFAQDSKAIIESGFGNIDLPGNRPYKEPGAIPINPSGSRRCTGCGVCAKLCPVGAIDPTSPRKVDKKKCIKCGRCIVVCPSHERAFRGLLYKIAGKKFEKAFIARREPETFFASRL